MRVVVSNKCDLSNEQGTWVARICLSDDIDGESANGCDRNIVSLVGGKGGHGGGREK